MITTIERLATGAELRAIDDHERRLTVAADVAAQADIQAEPYRMRRNAAAIELFRTSGQPAVRVWHDVIDVSRTLWGRILEQVHPEYLPRLRAEAEGLRARIARAEEEAFISKAPRPTELGTHLGRDLATIERKIERAETLLATIEELRGELDDAGLAAGPAADESELTGAAKARVERLTEIARGAAATVRNYDELGEQAQEVRNQTAIGLMNGTFGYRVTNAEVARLSKLTTARVAQLRTAY